MEVYLIRSQLGYRLEGYGESDQQWIKGLPKDEVVLMKAKRPRNPRHHRKMFALLQIVHDNLPEDQAERLPNTTKLLDDIKLEMGYYDEHIRMDGTIERKPKSISFGSMNQDKFQEFYKKTLDEIFKKYIHGSDEDRKNLEMEVLSFM